MANLQKSWKGAPYTNLTPLTPTNTYNTLTTANATFGTVSLVNTPTPYGTQCHQITFKTTGDIGYYSTNTCRFTSDTVTVTSTGAEVYKFSVWVWCDNRWSDWDNNVTKYVTGTSGMSNFVDSNQRKADSTGRIWRRYWMTGQTLPAATYGEYHTFFKNGTLTTDLTVLLCAPTFSAENYSGYVQPFVAGTRTNTQAIADVTNKNTITVNSLTYNTDGSFSFNANSNNYLTVPANSAVLNFNTAQTIVIWMKNNSPSAARRNPYNQAYGGGGTITHENDTNFNYYWGTAGNNNIPYSGFTSGFSVNIGETAMICLTRDASTVSWYKNGTFYNSTANPYGAGVVTGTSDITIGTGYAGAFGGNLYAVQLYTRALTAAEISQNFNALRGRYSL
jgi:hypothetical protein